MSGSTTNPVTANELKDSNYRSTPIRHSWLPKSSGVSKDTWIKIIIWFVPMIFMAGTIFAAFNHTSDRVDDHEQAIDKMSDKQQTIHEEQRIIKADIEAVKEGQKIQGKKLDVVDDQLRQQDVDLAVIREKLRVPRDE